MTKKITIGIPVYNKSSQISRTLLSIIKSGCCMNGAAGKILLVDDCSTDDSITIACQLLEDFNQDYKLINSSRNRGVAYARNLIISNCATDYLTFVDADDELYSDKFFQLINLNILNKTNYDLIIANIAQVSEGGDLIRVLSQINETREISQFYLADLITDYLKAPNRNGIFSQCFGKIFNVKFLHSKNICFVESLSNYEDVEFLGSVLCEFPRSIQINSCFYQYINYSLGSTESYSSLRSISTHTGYLRSIPKMVCALGILENKLGINRRPDYYNNLADNAISILTFITVVCHANKSSNLVGAFLFYRELKVLFKERRIQKAICNYDARTVPNGSPLLTFLCRNRLIFFASILARLKFIQRYGIAGSLR